MLDLEANREPTRPRDASTVLVLRNLESVASGGAPGKSADQQLEVYCVERHQNSGFMGGAIVFPGGKVDGSDRDPTYAAVVTSTGPRVDAMAGPTVDARALAVAAARETLEEAGIVATDPPLDHAAAQLLRAMPFLASGLQEQSLKLRLDALVPFSRWITPEAESRRFDARFFLLAAPDGQVGEFDLKETTQGFWTTPRRLMQRFQSGEIFLAPPTHRLLELLATTKNVDSALKLATEQSLEPICPFFTMIDGLPALTLPGDSTHSISDKRIAGATRFVLRDGRFLPEDE